MDRRSAGRRQIEGQLGACAAGRGVAGPDPPSGESDGRPQPSQEPHRATLPERQHQSVLGSHGSVIVPVALKSAHLPAYVARGIWAWGVGFLRWTSDTRQPPDRERAHRRPYKTHPPLAPPQRGDYNVITGECLMKVELVRIGNSRGIRIPKPLI